MKYREPFFSKCIYLSGIFKFGFRRCIKKVRKIWRQRREYFTEDYRKQKKCTSYTSTEVTSGSSSVGQCGHTAYAEYDSGGLVEKLAVYTCIYGNYDLVCEPLIKSKWCDYYIITDMDIPKKSVWKKIQPYKPDGFDSWNNSRKNRYYKMHPEVIFPEYRYSLYIDGNIKLLTDPYAYIPKMKNHYIGIHKYPMNDCAYVSADFLKSLGLVETDVSDAQMNAYRNSGFPEHFGYFECSVILREHNNPICIAVMDTWWNEYLKWVRRDQQSLPYSLWKNGMSASDVFVLGTNLQKSNPRLKRVEHKRPHFLVKGDS